MCGYLKDKRRYTECDIQTLQEHCAFMKGSELQGCSLILYNSVRYHDS